MVGNFIEELRWRGMLHDMTPGVEELLRGKSIRGYIGFDPTADSLHIGNLVQIIILMHFQRCGHTPIVLVGGATGMIGDPSGKSQERNLLDEETLRHNEAGIKAQLSRFLNFDPVTGNKAVMVNNYDWMKNIGLIDFARDVGKHITVNYMMAKDSVRKRLSADAVEGMSFTEFTYQLFQGYDFYHLYKEKDCLLQMGGSDQWGNITTGTELIRRKLGGKAYALTCPLITKSDGTKFGKSEGGNIWLAAERTSAYKFYQYWLNTTDEDAERYVKIFTFLSRETIADLIRQHKEAPHLRLLQKKIAEEVTAMVHSPEDTAKVARASGILFGKATPEDLRTLDERTFLDVFEGVPQAGISADTVKKGLPIMDALASGTGFLSSNSEARRALKENSIAVNKEKVNEEYVITATDLIGGKFVLLQRGKKNYFLLVVD
ncbi:MAG: tyrosine--tRNA ligase [Sinomicrobium sp.]|nr:tyrosine--tRNA ligase [Sinomicrobium sp.]